MLRARRMPRELACRCKGTIDIIDSFISLVLSDQTSTSLGLLSTHRDTFRAATRAAAFPDVDWRVRARFRRGSHTWAPRSLTGR